MEAFEADVLSCLMSLRPTCSHSEVFEADGALAVRPQRERFPAAFGPEDRPTSSSTTCSLVPTAMPYSSSFII